jgi:DNA/RNA-binding protein KIN17
MQSGDIIRVDQAELETVIPQVGGGVLVLSGPHRGSKATLLTIDTDKYTAEVRLRGGDWDGKTLRCEYEDISKLYKQ